ncbi:MAG: class I SAM-dependent methyltransferase [Acidobacteriia bacterium]|nr:class I SAM-dependent methyltransferase [Terriglobia bacterium]
MDSGASVERLYRQRTSRRLRERVYRLLKPPDPFLMNPAEAIDAPLGRWNLYIGGGGCSVEGYVNIDLFPVAGVDLVADAGQLPFPADLFQRVECDAVLEHVRRPESVMREIERVLKPGGFAHLVTPFCHPFHEYPRDYRRFTPDGLKELAGNLKVVGEGWRTGPTATMLVFTLEYVKLWLPWRWWRVAAHGVLGWLLFPFRYLDVLFRKSPAGGRIGNHCYVWLRK